VVKPWPLYPQGRDPVPIVQEAGWTPGPVWTGAENLAPTVQPVASRYTDCAILAQLMDYTLCYLEITRQTVRQIMGEPNILHYRWQHCTLLMSCTPFAHTVLFGVLCSISCVFFCPVWAEGTDPSSKLSCQKETDSRKKR
jgi:hypothetical protein